MSDTDQDNQPKAGSAAADALKPQSPWRASVGAPRKYKSPEDLWAACERYFDYVEENPIMEHKAFHSAGQLTHTRVPQMRAMTVGAMALHLGMTHDTWIEYTKRPEFSEVTTRARQIIDRQKFEGAAAGMLNPQIIARDLGLTDKTHADIKVDGIAGMAELSEMIATLNAPKNDEKAV